MKKRAVCVLLCIFTILSLASCEFPWQKQNKVLAEFDGGKIIAKELFDAVKYINVAYPDESEEKKAELYWEYVEKYVLLYLYEIEIVKDGIPFDEDAFQKSMNDYKNARAAENGGDYDKYLDKYGVSEEFFYKEQRYLALSTAINSYIKSSVIENIPDADAQDYYNEHIDNYAATYTTTAEHIWFYVKLDATEEEKQAQKNAAEKALVDIRNGASIEEAQKTAKATNPYGDIDIYVLTNVEKLRNSDEINPLNGKPKYILYNALFPDAFFSLKEGEFLPYVVETYAYADTGYPLLQGYHLVFVKEFVPVPSRTFEEAKEEIKQILSADKFSPAIENYKNSLGETYNTVYYK